MSDGLSIGGGLGGISGGGEIKPLKGLSDVGKADEGDITKFQTGLGKADAGAPGAKGVEVKGPSGPFDFQANRITDADIAKKPGLGEQLVGKAKEFLSVGRGQEKEIRMQLDKPDISAADTVKIQFMVGNFSVFTEVLSKGAGKVVQGVQAIVRQQ